MIQVAMVDNLGEIKYIFSPGEDPTYGDGEVIGDLTAHHIAPDIDPNLFIKENYWNGSSWATKPSSPGEFYNWNGVNWVFDKERLMLVVRRDRDMRLYQCDWTQLPDANVDSAAWATYRQALRDFPATITTETTLEELVWPTAP